MQQEESQVMEEFDISPTYVVMNRVERVTKTCNSEPINSETSFMEEDTIVVNASLLNNSPIPCEINNESP